jgi:hypothetical protein
MHAVAFVAVLSVMLGGFTPTPKSVEEYNQNVLDKLNNPVIEYTYKVNQ